MEESTSDSSASMRPKRGDTDRGTVACRCSSPELMQSQSLPKMVTKNAWVPHSRRAFVFAARVGGLDCPGLAAYAPRSNLLANWHGLRTVCASNCLHNL